MSSAKQRRGGGGRRRGNISSHDNNNSAASFIGSNLDILTLILTRLPLKSLLVFKSVSKQWLSMITNPQFVHKHFRQNPSFSIPGVFMGPNYRSEENTTYEYVFLDGNINNYVPFKTLTFTNDQRSSFIVVQSCNGLLLCRSRRSYEYKNTNSSTFYIFNPFTNQHRTVPQSQLTGHGFVELRSVSLAFDSLKSPYYKVISVWTRTRVGTRYRIEIYDSETSSWKLSGFDPDIKRSEFILYLADMFWIGSLHWCHCKRGTVVYFDIDRELIGEMPSLMQGFDNKKTYKIAECLGHFYLVAYQYIDCCFDIFRMDAAHSNWDLKARVDLRLNPHSEFDKSHPAHQFDHILLIVEGGEEGEPTKLVMLTKERNIFLYDLKEVSFEKLYDLSPKQHFPIHAHFYQNIESLACV